MVERAGSELNGEGDVPGGYIDGRVHKVRRNRYAGIGERITAGIADLSVQRGRGRRGRRTAAAGCSKKDGGTTRNSPPTRHRSSSGTGRTRSHSLVTDRPKPFILRVTLIVTGR